jgi:death-on-curing protein
VKHGPIFFPTTRDVDVFHRVVIAQRGEAGYVTKGLVEGSLEWAMTDVYKFIPFPSLLLKAAALMYAYTCFHPYSDGNKRTALMTTAFFLELNSYSLDIPDDAPEFARELALRTLDTAGHDPSLEIRRVGTWLRMRVRQPFRKRLDYAQRARTAIKLGLSGDVYVCEHIMSRLNIAMWAIEAGMKFRRFLPSSIEDSLTFNRHEILFMLLRANHEAASDER